MANKFVDLVDHLKTHAVTFVLSPARWQAFQAPKSLAWQSVQFVKKNNSKVPDKRGVYAFVVKHDSSDVPEHGFIMYFGITGETAANRTLRKRFGDYLREQKENKRPRIYYMMQRYRRALFFHFASITTKSVDMAQLEKALNDTHIPPKVTKDFSADVRKAVAAFRS
jgi:hypothetical protein